MEDISDGCFPAPCIRIWQTRSSGDLNFSRLKGFFSLPVDLLTHRIFPPSPLSFSGLENLLLRSFSLLSSSIPFSFSVSHATRFDNLLPQIMALSESCSLKNICILSDLPVFVGGPQTHIDRRLLPLRAFLHSAETPLLHVQMTSYPLLSFPIPSPDTPLPQGLRTPFLSFTFLVLRDFGLSFSRSARQEGCPFASFLSARTNLLLPPQSLMIFFSPPCDRRMPQFLRTCCSRRSACCSSLLYWRFFTWFTYLKLQSESYPFPFTPFHRPPFLEVSS